MTPDQILTLISTVCVLCAVTLIAVNFLNRGRNAAELRRDRNTKLAAGTLFLTAAGAAWATGDDIVSSGTLWFIFAMYQYIDLPTARKVRQQEKREARKLAKQRQAELERQTAAEDALADELGFPRMPRITDPAPHTEGPQPR